MCMVFLYSDAFAFSYSPATRNVLSAETSIQTMAEVRSTSMTFILLHSAVYQRTNLPSIPPEMQETELQETTSEMKSITKSITHIS